MRVTLLSNVCSERKQKLKTNIKVTISEKAAHINVKNIENMGHGVFRTWTKRATEPFTSFILSPSSYRAYDLLKPVADH